jgi:tRNA dimethylallyltransferase
MDIGSNKPSPTELQKVKHYNINIVNPDYHFTAGDFCARSSEAFKEITGIKKIPLMVGGTGFYIDSFFNGIDEIPDIDVTIRNKISSDYDEFGSEVLFNELKEVDPVFALKIHKNDKQRIIRGLSVFKATGRPITSYFRGFNKNSDFDILYIGIYAEKEELYKRIDTRVDIMVERGLVDEVLYLRSLGFHSGLNSMKSIGYAEINDFLDNKHTLDIAVEEIKRNTKKYAKKQLTWFRKNKNINWFLTDEIKKVRVLINNWLNKL